MKGLWDACFACCRALEQRLMTALMMLQTATAADLVKELDSLQTDCNSTHLDAAQHRRAIQYGHSKALGKSAARQGCPPV